MHLVDSYSRQLHPQLSKVDVVGAHAHPPADWEGEAHDLRRQESLHDPGQLFNQINESWDLIGGTQHR